MFTSPVPRTMLSTLSRNPSRRLTTVALTGLLSVVILLAGADRAFALNPIQAENQLPGTSAWAVSGGPSTAIEGYPTQMSLQAGQALQLHVSTDPTAKYQVQIYRLGYYQGLGGRLITCIPSCSSSEQGKEYPDNTKTGYSGADWPVTDTVTVGSNWTTGYYEAKLVLTSGSDSGKANYVPFFVLAPPGDDAPILVQASVNTWEAYNNWGGKSLYPFNSSGKVAATEVSFQRPFTYTGGNPGPFSWEYPLVRWLEKNGYDVQYQTDIDTDENPSSLLGHKLDVINGHDEYQSHTERLAWAQAVNDGVNLVAMGADIAYWQARYANNDTSLIEYRTASADPDPDPADKTVRFSQVGLPDCELLGVGFSDGAKADDPPSYDYTVTSAAATNPWFAGTGLTPGSTIFDSIGYEWDTIQSGCDVPPVTDLLHFAGASGGFSGPDGGNSDVPADAVTYTATSGARVFTSGSLQLVWALDDTLHASPSHTDTRVQALFTNIFNSLSGISVPAPPQAPAILHLKVRRVRGKLRLAVTLSEPAALKIGVWKLVFGRMAQGRCSSSAKHGRGCWIWERVLVRYRRQLGGGLSRLRLRMQALPPRKYLVAVTATGSGGRSIRKVWITIVHRY